MMNTMRLVVAFALLCALSAPARADKPDGCNTDDQSSGKKQGKFHIEYINGKPVTVIDTTVVVCGKVPRPSVIYVLAVKQIDYEWENLKQDFMPLILETVKKAPF
jgi:hypothetical protein